MPENITASLVEIRKQAAEFLAHDVTNTIALHQRTVPKAKIKDQDQLIRADIRAASKKAGFYYKTQAQEYGGSAASILELILLWELLSASNLPYVDAMFGPGPGVLHGVEGYLETQYLKPLMSGLKQTAFGFTEPTDAPSPTCAVIVNDTLILNGQKSYVSNGADADFVSILTRLENGAGESQGSCMLVVDVNAEGVSISNQFESMDGGGHVAMEFKDVKLSLQHIIGKPGEGLPRALSNISSVRLMVASKACGICLWVLEFLENHLRAPHRSGTPLGQKEGVRLQYANLRIDTYVARSALYRTARIVESGENSINEVIATKVFCTETVGRVVDMAIQLVGGQALIESHPLAKLYKEVRSLRLVEGANDLLRLNLSKGNLELNKGRL